MDHYYNEADDERHDMNGEDDDGVVDDDGEQGESNLDQSLPQPLVAHSLGHNHYFLYLNSY